MCGFGKCVCARVSVRVCMRENERECQEETSENGNEHTRKPFFMCLNAENVAKLRKNSTILSHI